MFPVKFLFIFVVSFTIVFSSCEKIEMATPAVEKITKKSVASDKNSPRINPVIINAAAYSSATAPFTITGFTIEDEIIMLTTNHQGGCGSADYILVSDGNVGSLNGKPLVKLKLKLDDRDPCKKVIGTKLGFDLTPIHQPNANSMTLNIKGIGFVSYSY